MRLIDQRTKVIMEECKARARAFGLQLHGDTLEYIVTNQDMIELRPKVMIPTLYDYWVHDVEVVRDKWIYEVYPHNAYETAINTRPAISFYNDNNPDWLNAMIFYHVLGHHDFFQNNVFFRNTWDDDFCGQALADSRLVNRIREELGAENRWVDYVIEFARSIDNLVGYYEELEEADQAHMSSLYEVFSERAQFYFGEFLGKLCESQVVQMNFYYDEWKRYNACRKQFGSQNGDASFFSDPRLRGRFPEFNSVFEKWKKQAKPKIKDILHHLIENSEFIDKEQNKWMKDVLGVVRRTSLYFQPQIRTKIANEGWASLCHERMFVADEKSKSHEVDFAIVNAHVVVAPRVGINPYFIGKCLLEFIEEQARKGKLSYAFQLIKDAEVRKRYDKQLGEEYGRQILFEARRSFDDYMLVNFLSDNDFQDFVNRYNLFVAGVRPSKTRWGFVEIYIKSRSGKAYRAMLNKTLYHPPHVVIDEEKAKDGELYLDHIFEGRTLVTRYIPQVLIGLAYLHGGKVALETTEFEQDEHRHDMFRDLDEPDYKKVRVLYTCEGKKVSRAILS